MSTSSSAPTIVIVGGVAGGASAATRARRCNEQANIILFEKDPYVSFANCGLPYYLGNVITDRAKLLVATPQFLEKRFNIQVRTLHLVKAIDRARKQVTVEDRQTGKTFTQSYDKLILSPGASPILPPMEGLNSRNVCALRNLEDTDRIKNLLIGSNPAVRHVTVVGAGFIGLEMVEMIRGLGLEVSLVELAPQVLPPLDPEMAAMIQEELIANGVKLRLGNGLKGLDVQGVMAKRVLLADGSAIDTDLVILSIGVRPNVILAQQAGLTLGSTGGIAVNDYLQTSDPDIYAIGDAVEYRHAVTGASQRVPLAGPANRAGRLAGQHAVTGQSPRMGPVLGTAIVRVFNKVAAVTGLSQRTAVKAAQTVKVAYITANQHAGYYPGAMPMTLKIIYDPATRRLLGAQIVGAEGVDKRIDILATALQFQATLDQLADLDLAYAPPFGSAKDPVHMAAFTALNDLDDLSPLTVPSADDAQAQLVDVRTVQEVARLSIPGAIHIPLDELRHRLGELDPSRPTLVTCASGLRSHIATRILKQHGFARVKNITGGANLRRYCQPQTVKVQS